MNSVRLLCAALLPIACTDASTARVGAPTLDCSPPEIIAALPAPIHEASGVAPSRLNEGMAWVHNDSEGEPALYALDQRGRIAARLSLPASLDQQDWEDIATAACGDVSCIYIADIGDNQHDRTDIAVLRFREPAIGDTAVTTVQRFPIRYPDGAHDAEAMFVLTGERVFIITKGRDTAVSVYRYPGALRPETVTLERVQQLTSGIAQLPDLVTGAAAATDDHLVAVRTYARLQLYHVDNDTLALAGAADLTPLGEPQGEGVAIASDGSLLLVSEAGPLAAAAPYTRLRCTLPR